jgi:hypothetical protein
MTLRGDHSKDKSSHWLISRQAGSILRLAGITGYTSWTTEESSLVSPRRLPDGLVRVSFQDRTEPISFVIEIESYSNTDADRQMYEDLLLCRLDRGVIPEGICVVLRPKGNVRNAGQFESISLLGTSRASASWRLVELWKLNAADLLTLNDIGLIPWVPLTQIDGPAEPVLRECRARIDQQTPEADRGSYLAVTEILAGMAHPLELLELIFRRGTPMIDSPVFARWEAQAKQALLVEVLEGRFDAVPEDVGSDIEKVYNLRSLNLLARNAGSCSNIDEFRSLLAKVEKK